MFVIDPVSYEAELQTAIANYIIINLVPAVSRIPGVGDVDEGRLEKPEEFENIVIRALPSGEVLSR